MIRGRPRNTWKTPAIDGITVGQYVYRHINAARKLEVEMNRRLREAAQPKGRLFDADELDEEFLKIMRQT